MDYTKDQTIEFRKIVDFLLSKDLEVSNMGIQLLRKSNLYKGLKPQSLIYYSKKVGSLSRVRVSTLINSKLRVIHNLNSSKSMRGKARMDLRTMFDDLLSSDCHKFFRREFINTSKFL